MKNKWLGYSIGIVAYMFISKALENKESSLSKYIHESAEKLQCILGKFMDKRSFSNKENDKENPSLAQEGSSEKDKSKK